MDKKISNIERIYKLHLLNMEIDEDYKNLFIWLDNNLFNWKKEHKGFSTIQYFNSNDDLLFEVDYNIVIINSVYHKPINELSKNIKSIKNIYRLFNLILKNEIINKINYENLEKKRYE